MKKIGIGYIIKTTYLTGPHTGKVHYLTKGGYVTDLGNIHWDDTTYKTLGFANRQCKHLAEVNAADYEFETQMRNRKVLEGKSDLGHRIYELESYEPVEVEVIGSEF